IPTDGSLVKTSWGTPALKLHGDAVTGKARCGDLNVAVSGNPLTFTITDAKGAPVQRISVGEGAVVSFGTGNNPLLALGEGGPQFDRRGLSDTTRNGQGGYKLHTHGARVAIPWIIGTSGWAMFIHHPHGKFDLTGTEGKFTPETTDQALPLDIFVVGSSEP